MSSHTPRRPDAAHHEAGGTAGSVAVLKALVRSNRAIIGDLSLPDVLDQIVRAACELMSAPFGALAVLSPERDLTELVTSGRGEALHDLVLDRMRRAGVRGAGPGGSSGDPATATVLGVAIRIRDTVVGDLYTCRDDGRPFSDDEEEVLQSLAATAGIAIENARLFDEARRRQQWLAASTRITGDLLAGTAAQPLRAIARSLQELAVAGCVAVVSPSREQEETRLSVLVAIGDGADELCGAVLDGARSATAQVLATGRPSLVGPGGDTAEHALLDVGDGVGSLMLLPLGGPPRIRGVLVVARRVGQAPFAEADVSMATTFADHAATALELADARADRQRMVLLEERDRIARDLHDHVIQRLFAAGLTVESVAVDLGDGPSAGRLTTVIAELDSTIQQIRDSIFNLRGSLAPHTAELRSRLLDLVADLRPALGFDPQLRFIGPIDAVVPSSVFDDVEAVVREGLTNVVRHADASAATVTVTATGNFLRVEVSDDGRGMSGTGRRSGLDNLWVRAERLGGSFAVSSPAPTVAEPVEIAGGGTRLRWQIPVR